MLKIILLLLCGILGAASSGVVKREERATLVTSENGEISAVRVGAINGSSYLLHFFTLDPNSLFLPVLLHADMVFYVHTGSGRLSWTDKDYKLTSTDLRRGDVYRLHSGAVFFIQSNLDTEAERQKLRIHAIFSNSNYGHDEPTPTPYSSIRDMVLGFDKKVLQAALLVPAEEIEDLLNAAKPAAIIHSVSRTKRETLEMEARLIGRLIRSTSYNILDLPNKKGKTRSMFNLFKEDKDFENCNGWSTTVTKKKLSALKGTDLGVFMVNLTAGSMMGPHWNPMATEIAVVLQGRGMVRVVCSNETYGCKNMRFEVEEGDVFVVPRFHAMAQMAFNNETLVFMGFATAVKRNHPQFLAGQASVFRVLDKDVLAMSFNVTNVTIDQLSASQQDSVILGCLSCAEEELRIVEEEIEKEREAAREREEEEARKREEERRKEEEEERKREEEEARKKEEERRREEEEARKREEEEARREEEERKKRAEEEEAARREKEEEERREEEEEERREEEERARKEEEEEARRQEEERKRREEEEEIREEEERAGKEEEEEARRQEEERKRREEEEEERKRREEQEEEEEEARMREEEEASRRREEEEERQRQEEEAREREEESARRQERERRRQEEEEEEASRRREEEEERRRREVKAREREEEEARRQERERRRREREEEEEGTRRREEEETREEEEQRGGRSEEEQAAEAERRREEAAGRKRERWQEEEGERWQEEEDDDDEEQ